MKFILLAAASLPLAACASVTRSDLPAPTRYEFPGNYDRLASCFARRSQDRGIVNPAEQTPVLQRYSYPDEIRVSMGLTHPPLVWMLDFKPTGPESTTVEFRMDMQYLGAQNIRRRVFEDLRSCGADVS